MKRESEQPFEIGNTSWRNLTKEHTKDEQMLTGG
jgi:hypothetical protein